MLHDYETILSKIGDTSFLDNSKVQICCKLNGGVVSVQKVRQNGKFEIVILKKNNKRISEIDFVLSNYYKLIYDFCISNIDKFNTKYIYQFVYNPLGVDKIILNGLFSSSSKQIIDYNFNLFDEISKKLNIKKNLPIKKFCEEYPLPKFENNEEFKNFIETEFKERIEFEDIDTFVISTKCEDKKLMFKVSKNADKVTPEFDFFVKIIISDIIQFMLNHEMYWEKIELYSKNIEKKYLEFIYIIFKVFMIEKNSRYRDLYIKQPAIFKHIIFQLNYDSIEDAEVIKVLNRYPIYGEIILKYFILLFNKRKNNKSEFLNEYNLITQNYLFEKIKKIIN